ncbi:MAG: bifunctional 4'-phosphopantothenoylcysteine decarboxylase/phosphopantothenoylcysteine synthetase, partial [Gammaproteobacteria bacterium]|nr:bifunctional 4'-phosphopantothenoylcysteine decarboxylase/phosphopantothenoylcysteine synthetase [Gammaproteobacteria bacterium]
KMGFSLAEAAQEAGAKVILIAGPVALSTPQGVERIDVDSAEQMLAAVLQRADEADIFIATAAVADYRPVTVEKEKLKKHQTSLTLELERNPDILAKTKSHFPELFCVGFAAETEKLGEHAQQKLYSKGVDMIAANWVGHAAARTGGTFGSDESALQVFWHNGQLELAQASKSKLGRQLISVIAQRYDMPASEKKNNVVKLK